jgi:hypothetical protein
MRSIARGSAILLLLCVPCFGNAAEDARSTVTIDFEDSDAGGPPAGFTIAVTGTGEPPNWIVRETAGAPSGERVLVQTSTGTAGSRFPLCIYDRFVGADTSLAVRFQPLGGSVDQAAGIVWRYQNPSNYYIVRANALEGNVVLYKVENGKRSDLKPVGSGLWSYGEKATVERGTWQQLKVDVRGPRFRVSLNGAHLFDVEDRTFAAPGKTGLWTKADSVTAFDDLTIDLPTGQMPSSK